MLYPSAPLFYTHCTPGFTPPRDQLLAPTWFFLRKSKTAEAGFTVSQGTVAPPANAPETPALLRQQETKLCSDQHRLDNMDLLDRFCTAVGGSEATSAVFVKARASLDFTALKKV